LRLAGTMQALRKKNGRMAVGDGMAKEEEEEEAEEEEEEDQVLVQILLVGEGQPRDAGGQRLGHKL
jgi:hypothetical protein